MTGDATRNETLADIKAVFRPETLVSGAGFVEPIQLRQVWVSPVVSG